MSEFTELFDTDEELNFADTTADLRSQPITGYLPDGRRINIPLISHIVDNLYVGGHDMFVDLGDKFSHIFSLYLWDGPYKTAETTVHHVWKSYDSPAGFEAQDENENFISLDEIADQVTAALQEGGNVLVHCQAGINRSNIVAAATLRKLKHMTSAEAIALLRERRSNLVLANKSFERLLLSLDASA
jgi:hypothetical protein